MLLGPLVFVQRRLHRELQAVLLLLTRQKEITVALFSILFFPGVLLHEASHYFTARLLGVHPGKFSLLPRTMEDGRLQLGYVQTTRTDILRDSLIGVAPLLGGGGFVAYAGIVHWQLPALWESLAVGEPASWFTAISNLYSRPDFWLWFYVTVAVSSTMMPSRSDRRAWLPILLVVLLLFGLSWMAGAGSWVFLQLGPTLNQVLRALAVIFGISLAVHLVLLPPLRGLRYLLERLTGLKVV